MLVMLTELLSGLALFLFGMKFMSEGLQKAAGDKMRVILDRVTKNRFIAVIFGAIFTAIIQSSGATTRYGSQLCKCRTSYTGTVPLVLHLVPTLVQQLLHSLFL